jgi:ATP-dependent Clp protease ATP-binding subunit ClpC
VKRRKKGKDVDLPDHEDVDAAARAAAQSLAKRFGPWPDPDALAADPEFVRISKRLAAPAVPAETVERLGRGSNPVVAAMAHRACALRESVSPEWLAWAYGRLKHAYAGELAPLLSAIERHDEPPLLARVLARADSDWSSGWCLGVVTAFVKRRLRAGEGLSVAEFEQAVPESQEALVAAVMAELGGTLPAETIREFEQWHRGREQVAFFRSIGRVHDLRATLPALASVGRRAAAIETLDATLRQSKPGSALLVGEHGVGKSAVIRETLRSLQEAGWLVFEAGAAEINAGQVYVGQLEGRVREIAERAADRRVVWIMPSFESTLWSGQSTQNPRGLLDALLPLVEAGRLVIVGEVEPRAYELLVQQRPRVTSAFETIRLEPLTRDEAIAVARDWRDRVEADVDDATIGDAYDLAEHYFAGVAAPARVLRLLKATLASQDDAKVRTQDVLATLSEATGLPLHVVDPESPLDLADVRQFFSSRILGQEEAVDCLVDRIALIKASLTDPTRPLAVFLFVGPTGTGKTEIAKTLAEFLFGSPDRLVRLDMSEFQTEQSFERLLADSSSEQEAAALISSVRANPFSVVLLDEFEKAHRNVWSLFLQLFDDGRLTDRQGRTADFRQCVVILTSNLGAAIKSVKPLGFAGGGGEQFRPAAIEKDISRVFTPEFLNRIDRVVVFRPFEREQMRALLERELSQVLERRGFRTRPWAVEWDDTALEFLAEKGFSPTLGARPLRRAVEQYLLAPLAAAIVSRSFPEGEQFLFLTAREDRIEVTFIDPDADEGEPSPEPSVPSLRLERLVFGSRGAPEESEFLASELERLRGVIDGEGWRGCKERDLEAIQREGFWDSSERIAVLDRIEYVDRVQASLRTAEKLSSRLTRLDRNGRRPAADLVQLMAERLYLLDRACTNSDASAPSDAFLEVSASPADRPAADFALELQAMYEAWARRRGMRSRRLWSDATHLFAISGIGAYQILSSEAGLHVFESPHGEGAFDRIAVQVAVATRPAAPPDTDVLEQARRALAELPAASTIVRRYRTKPSPLVRDSVRHWRTGRLDRVLAGEFDVIVDS